MPTLAEIRDAVDARLAVLWPKVKARQTTYAANHNGNFWQGIRFCALPADGGNGTPDLSLKPTDQPTSWADALPGDVNISEPMALSISVYAGPSGQGYTGTAEVTVAGVRYARTQNEGPEAWRQHGWRVMPALGQIAA